MPPKKKAAAGKDDGASDKAQLQRAQAEILALQRLLELKTYEAVEARSLERSWRQRDEAAEAAQEQSRQDMADIKADIARQHASIQEHASTQVHVLEGRLAELQGQLAAAQKTAEDAASQHKRLLQEKDQQAAAHQLELQQLHAKFAALMQDTLGQLRAQLQEEYSAACGGS